MVHEPFSVRNAHNTMPNVGNIFHVRGNASGINYQVVVVVITLELKLRINLVLVFKCFYFIHALYSPWHMNVNINASGHLERRQAFL